MNFIAVTPKPKEAFISKKGMCLSLLVVAAALMLMPDLAHASLESSLDGMRTKLTGVILPVLSVIGIGLAAVSFFTGNPQAKQHIFYAVIGAILGFGAQSIVDFIAQTVH
jgi:hypothetical protein